MSEQGSSPSSDLGAWMHRLRAPTGPAPNALPPSSAATPLDADAVDNAIGWAAEHARRYVASDGDDDG